MLFEFRHIIQLTLLIMSRLKYFILLIFFVSLGCSHNKSEEKLENSDTLASVMESSNDGENPQKVYITHKGGPTEEDAGIIANYECNDGISKKISKLYPYGHSSFVFFSEKENYAQQGIYANFLNEDWCQTSLYLLYTFKLCGRDSIISVFPFTDKNRETSCTYWVCISNTFPNDEYEGPVPGYYVNMFIEECGNQACYIEEATPDSKAYMEIMSKVRKYEDFTYAWTKYLKTIK